MAVVYEKIGEYRLGKLSRPSKEYPRGQWCAVWGGKEDRRRWGLGVGLERDKIEALGALAEFVKRRQAAEIAVSKEPLSKIVEAYIQERRAAGRQIKNAECHWKALSTVFGSMMPEGVELKTDVQGKQLSMCHHYAVLRSDAGKARDTVWSELLFLRTVLNWAEAEKLIDKAPKVWVPSKGPGKNIVITEDEGWALIEACVMPHIRLFAIIALCTAARTGAILELTWDRVDFARGVVDFNKPINRDILDSGFKKGRSAVAMNDMLRYALTDAKNGARTQHVIEWNGSRVESIKTGFYAAVRRAGLEGRKISPHVLRHASASWMAEADVSMRKIQRMLGHKTQKTTETIYANKARPTYLTEAANVIDSKMRKRNE